MCVVCRARVQGGWDHSEATLVFVIKCPKYGKLIRVGFDGGTHEFLILPVGPESDEGDQDGLRLLFEQKETCMKDIDRITLDPALMGGKPCIRGLRVTVGTVIGLLAAGRSREEILKAYPYLEAEDIDQALAYAAWRVEEREVSLPVT